MSDEVFQFEARTFVQAVNGLSGLVDDFREKLMGVHIGPDCMFASDGHKGLAVLWGKGQPVTTRVSLPPRVCRAIVSAFDARVFESNEAAVVRAVEIADQTFRLEVKAGGDLLTFGSEWCSKLDWPKVIPAISSERRASSAVNLSLVADLRDAAARVLGLNDVERDEDDVPYRPHINVFVQQGATPLDATRFDFYTETDSPIGAVIGVLMPLRETVVDGKTLRPGKAP